MDTYIFLTGRIVPGQPIDWNISPLVREDELQDGTIQNMIDLAQQELLAEEWTEYWLDQEREFPR